jgi:hypothetical protein
LVTIYFATPKALTFFLNRLKLLACPNCHLTGNLNRHDITHGQWSAPDCPRPRKGQRAFCSNRGNRDGCGKTIALLLSSYIKHHSIPSGALFRLLSLFLSLGSVRKVFNSLALLFSLTTLHRLLRAIILRQVKIRSALNIICRPADADHRSDLHQTIRHLEACFPDSINPVSAFQTRFQTSIL